MDSEVEYGSSARIFCTSKPLENPKLKRRNSIMVFSMFMKDYALGNFKVNDHSIQPWDDFRNETRKAMKSIISNTGRGENIAVFTSGGTIGSIVGENLGVNEDKIVEMNLAIRNTSFSNILFSNNKANLLTFNEVPHLDEELISFV